MQTDDTTFPSVTKSLLEQIGIDPRDFAWQHLAACDGMPVNMFFDDYEKDGITAQNVDQLCLSCPIARECYQFGVETKSTGVFGGFYLINGIPSKARNVHKSQETALRLAEKVLG